MAMAIVAKVGGAEGAKQEPEKKVPCQPGTPDLKQMQETMTIVLNLLLVFLLNPLLLCQFLLLLLC